MCDYCGCREAEPLAELSREHAVLAGLGSDLRDAVQAGFEEHARALFRRIVEILGPHVRKEERGVFASVRAEGGLYQHVVEELSDEHAALEHVIEHAIEHVDDVPSEWEAEAIGLLRALDEHIFKEEWDLFPVAHGILGFADLGAIAEVHAEEGSALDTPPDGWGAPAAALAHAHSTGHGA